MTTEAIARKWGNSIGVILPREVIMEKHISEGDVVIISDVIKKTDLTGVFGSVKTGESGQKFKDRVRKGWE